MVCMVLAASAIAAPAPSEKQIAAFSNAIEKAWKSGDAAALEKEREQNGITEGLTDVHLGYWEALLQQNQETPKEWGGVKYLSREEGLTEHPYRNTASYRAMVEDRVINGRRYAVNLPVCGFVTLYFFGKSGIVTPVGINDEGHLKMAEHIPVDGKPEDYQLPTPLTVQGIATTKPSEKALARFKEAVTKAFEAGDLLPVTHTEGVPLDQLDRNTRQGQMLLSPKTYTLSNIEFIPASENTLQQKNAPPASEPVKWGHHWYALNLPFVGYTKIATKPKDSENGEASVTKPTGITPSGELKLVLPALVTPPSP